MTETYPGVSTTPTPTVAPASLYERFPRTIRATGATLAGASLAVLGASCGEVSSPQPPRNSFVELKPDHSRLIDPNNPLAGMNPFPEPEGGWNPHTLAEAYHLSELVKGNQCTPKPGSKPLVEKHVKVGNFEGDVQLKATNPDCEDSFYTRAETQTDAGNNTAVYEVEHRVIPGDPAINPYRVRQESIPDRPDQQAWTVQTALKLGDRVISCIISGGDEACINPYTVGQPASQ